jgi:hypothetical protein
VPATRIPNAQLLQLHQLQLLLLPPKKPMIKKNFVANKSSPLPMLLPCKKITVAMNKSSPPPASKPKQNIVAKKNIMPLPACTKLKKNIDVSKNKPLLDFEPNKKNVVAKKNSNNWKIFA